MTQLRRDDLGTPVALARAAQRVVSLVPSLTEAIAVSAPGLLVGATDYCVHPADLAVTRVGGSRWPDLDAIRALQPDLVVANKECNGADEVAALRADGIAVWVTYPRTVDEALASIGRLLAAMGVVAPEWLRDAAHVWAAPAERTLARRAVIPIWRRPWIVVGADTFIGDVLSRLGVRNRYDHGDERYPRPTLEQVRAAEPDLVVLPDEPYTFSATDGPEAFPGLPCALVSGRHLSWYGPSLVEAREVLAGQLARAWLS